MTGVQTCALPICCSGKDRRGRAGDRKAVRVRVKKDHVMIELLAEDLAGQGGKVTLQQAIGHQDQEVVGQEEVSGHAVAAEVLAPPHLTQCALGPTADEDKSIRLQNLMLYFSIWMSLPK